MNKQNQKRGIEKVLRPIVPEDNGYPMGYITKRFTWKLFGGSYGSTWADRGKYYKKRLSKSRRQYYKAIDSGLRPRKSYRGANSISNWKGW